MLDDQEWIQDALKTFSLLHLFIFEASFRATNCKEFSDCLPLPDPTRESNPEKKKSLPFDSWPNFIPMEVTGHFWKGSWFHHPEKGHELNWATIVYSDIWDPYNGLNYNPLNNWVVFHPHLNPLKRTRRVSSFFKLLIIARADHHFFRGIFRGFLFSHAGCCKW